MRSREGQRFRRACGLRPDTIRYYERIGLLSRIVRRRGACRRDRSFRGCGTAGMGLHWGSPITGVGRPTSRIGRSHRNRR
ncbi:MerR family DNA-binding transcriptional regulator [Sphingomonas sanguinis]|uniref:MerR family DNA-binding transcriptional regulator n=1 Tax=Sphingomonas sanguinis TaxID=33051 RepID=UPI00128E9590